MSMLRSGSGRLAGEFNLMLFLHMSAEVILPFDTFIPDSLAAGDWTIAAFLEMLRLPVAGQALLRLERG